MNREPAAALRLRNRLGMNEANFEYLINHVRDPALLAHWDSQMRDRIARAIVEVEAGQDLQRRLQFEPDAEPMAEPPRVRRRLKGRHPDS